ncbi:MAG TPA: cell division protein ZapA [Candidatus Kapabacteria bacterium]|nr:cell division protein ZapA [Candidatus Kapabacteria bacterium]
MGHLKVTIDGTEYTLTSENHELLNQAVVIVDKELQGIKNKYKHKLNKEAMTILTSLNLVENMIQKEIEYTKTEQAINLRINELMQQLEKKLN